MKGIIVPLIRRFVPAKPLLGDWEFLHPEPSGSVQGWRELEEYYRVLVLADPGAGKTFEAKDRATKLREKGVKAFFIRIEAITRMPMVVESLPDIANREGCSS